LNCLYYLGDAGCIINKSTTRIPTSKRQLLNRDKDTVLGKPKPFQKNITSLKIIPSHLWKLESC
jgi:hypothetical protein